MAMEESLKYCKVCVTGGAGYIGSSLVKKLLDRGTYIVHATLRDLGDNAKVDLLQSLPGAETRLQLFEADVYNPEQFEAAINDCQYVFHVATPMLHMKNSKYKNTSEAAVAGVRSIAMSCITSGTVRRLIYTASVTAASPLKNDGHGFLNFMDENCWTPLNSPFSFAQESDNEYVISKTESERELLKYVDAGSMEIVSLVCGLVGGETLLSYIPASVSLFPSQLTDKLSASYQQLRLVEELCGKVPVLHIEDACEAHIFCMQKESLSGRLLCASDYVSSAEIAECYAQNHPEFQVNQVLVDELKRAIKWASTKLIDEGFKYNYDLKMILDDSARCAKRFNLL